jgi:DNA-binding NarL/FixJ family response regulator
MVWILACILIWAGRLRRRLAACDTMSMGERQIPLKRIRILLAGMPTLLVDVLHHVVAAEPDMEIVGRIGGDDLLEAVRRTQVDVILVGPRLPTSGSDYLGLLRQRPRLRVVAFADDGKNGALYEMRPRRIALPEMSRRALCRSIRGRSNGRTGPRKTVEA